MTEHPADPPPVGPPPPCPSRVSTCLWFDRQAEEAVAFYVSLLPNSRTLFEQRYGDWGPGPVGAISFLAFELDRTLYQAMNGRPGGAFSEAASIFVRCQDQAEIDRLWNALGDGGKTMQCGWLVDRFGVSWQIVPARIGELLMKGDAPRSDRMMGALMAMEKIDIEALDRAYHAN